MSQKCDGIYRQMANVALGPESSARERSANEEICVKASQAGGEHQGGCKSRAKGSHRTRTHVWTFVHLLQPAGVEDRQQAREAMIKETRIQQKRERVERVTEETRARTQEHVNGSAASGCG